ncbi:MAG: hypothetical protein OXL38_12995 [Gammaproteobacteria bacterium]|nr:hypothetical protein [Gammaproteobacteria bacterium]
MTNLTNVEGMMSQSFDAQGVVVVGRGHGSRLPVRAAATVSNWQKGIRTSDM